MSTGKNIYFISGLGADKRIFDHLTLSKEYPVQYIEWIKPFKNEPVTAYCHRLCEQVKIKHPAILIGVSFGGMIAQEIAKFTYPEKVIILSSIKNYGELSFYLKLLGKLRIHKIFPMRLLIASPRIASWFLGVEGEKERMILEDYLSQVDHGYLRWSIDLIIGRKLNFDAVENLTHIHGTADRVLPIRFTNPHYAIEHGGHFMVYNKAREIDPLLKHLVNS